MITEEKLEELCVLSQLELSLKERNLVKQDLETMLELIDKLHELDSMEIEMDTTPRKPVFREDVVMVYGDCDGLLSNAPKKQGRSFQVPKTVEHG